jgi:glycosyltransferase involved in cell wall biosynthesis
MRILVTAHRISVLGGAEMSVLQLTRALAHRGHEIDLFYNIGGELESEYRTFCRSVSRAHLAVRRPGLTGNLIRASPALLAGRRQRPQVVFVQRFDDIPFGALTGRLARAPVVCHLRGFNNYRTTPPLARQVSRFIAVSEATKGKFAAAGVDPERIDVVHNGIDPQDYPFGGIEERTRARLALGLPAEAFIVLYYGRFDVTKGIEVLLDAWRQLEPPAESARLVLMGQSATDAYTRRLQELAPDGCQWLPTRRDVLTPLHAADVVVLPSFHEDFGRVVIEAMATGRPIVGSRAGGIPEILSGRFASFLFEPGDAIGLSRVLRELVDWRSRDPGLAERFRSHIQQHFNLQSTADGVERVLRKATSSGFL